MQQISLEFGEQVTLSLRALYEQYGFTQYKMSKFEEYDLYARNKDFLISDGVITFTDTNGKLMALKPDVTLSIVKNSQDDPNLLQKVYYTENVYRVSKGSHAFKEIMQVGLECLGCIDAYCICEVLSLAAQSLQTISPSCILDISHVGVLSEMIDRIGATDAKMSLFKYIGEKNVHELTALCQEINVSEENIARLCQVINTVGKPSNVLSSLAAIMGDLPSWQAFEQVVKALPQVDMLRIDFSVVDDIHYYNGFVFKGFVQGLPSSVLSGGQYDKLMRKMNRKSGAIGFAVYTDMLERLQTVVQPYDVDVVLLYDENTTLTDLQQHVARLIADGNRVIAQRTIADGIRYKQLLKVVGNEVTVLENNA